MRFLLTATILSTTTLLAQTQSPHRRGPHGLEGWTRSEDVEGQGMLPVELILARNGRMIRRINDGPFIWRWLFLHNGKQIGYETGPLHFSMTCVLVEVASGRQLATYDCFSELPQNAPRWVELMEAKGQESFAKRSRTLSSLPRARPPR